MGPERSEHPALVFRWPALFILTAELSLVCRSQAPDREPDQGLEIVPGSTNVSLHEHQISQYHLYSLRNSSPWASLVRVLLVQDWHIDLLGLSKVSITKVQAW
jgi:hypothetical protein